MFRTMASAFLLVVVSSLFFGGCIRKSPSDLYESNSWSSMAQPATRFPYYPGEAEPRSSRACHDEWSAFGPGGQKYFVAVADTSTSPILWPSGLAQCTCPNGGSVCEMPSCDQSQGVCRKKIKIRCKATDTTCKPEFRGRTIVVQIRDICPKRHRVNQDANPQNCQGGDHIDIYRDLYTEMTGQGTSGANLNLEFSDADQSAPLGPDPVTPAQTPSQTSGQP